MKDKMKKKMYYNTPLLKCHKLSKLCKIPAYLKMENVQPSGSYKIRGMSNLVEKSVKDGSITKLVSASGGNAGMATAYAGRTLNIPTTVVIPETTPKLMISKLKEEGANVQVHGSVWNDAQEKALELSNNESTFYVHPFDHPFIWEGIEPLVEEIVEQCPESISAIVLSVGGGGLLCGVLQGLLKLDLKIPVVAMETEGAHCLNAALKVGKSVSIGKITSIAKTLGALSVTPHVFDLLPRSNVISELVTDAEAVAACIEFANDSRGIVEPSCGAALAAGYSNVIQRLVHEGKIDKTGAVVFIVCGGNAVTLELLQEWKETFGI